MGVMSVKLGTKTWGENRGESRTSSEPGSQAGSLTPEEQKAFGEKDIGAVLNKVADPNWTDPAKKIRTAGNDKLDKDAFFKLMLAQLKQQDPSNPLKSHEMAAQLAQFSGLEQMTNMNQSLTELKNAAKPAENFQSLNLIGKAVAGDSSKISRAAFDKEHEFRFNLNSDATDATIRVRGADGETVRSYNMKNLKAGAIKMSWNGENENGQKMPPGDYQFVIEAHDMNGKKIAAQSEFSGMITGVNFTPQGPVLQVGKQTVRLQDVSQITDPSLMKNDQKSVQDLKAQTEVSDTNSKLKQNSEANSEDTTPKGNLLNNVGLSREMIDKIKKQTAASANLSLGAPTGAAAEVAASATEKKL